MLHVHVHVSIGQHELEILQGQRLLRRARRAAFEDRRVLERRLRQHHAVAPRLREATRLVRVRARVRHRAAASSTWGCSLDHMGLQGLREATRHIRRRLDAAVCEHGDRDRLPLGFG